ncbi:hypothetical protein KO566_08340 [Flavobacteriaceae bacterium XHP0103]|uniref:HYC_CC_PP family protein n=1 Tax=Marixanthotalea marina TaxID=2844359 RepID=UPI002989E231|nr:hypothetical protein [Marixanthotalea marina]MBU3822065.1 hypothetical protein [Marixanthotalea marina]
MKKLFFKIMSMLMAVVVLISTMSFTIDMHYCGDKLVAATLFKKGETCGMEMQKQDTSSECSIVKKNCCSDEQLLVDGQDDLQLTVNKISVDQQIFLLSFTYAYHYLFQPEEAKAVSLSQYPPPRIVKQIYKLDETYLI